MIKAFIFTDILKKSAELCGRAERVELRAELDAAVFTFLIEFLDYAVQDHLTVLECKRGQHQDILRIAVPRHYVTFTQSAQYDCFKNLHRV